MAKKLASVLILSLIGLFGLLASAGASTVSFTDTRFGGEFYYQMDITPTGTTNVYDVDFKVLITTPASGTWYADWFVIKFDGNPSTILPVSSTPTTGWKAWDSNNNVKLWGGSNPAQILTTPPNAYYNVSRPSDGRVGYYFLPLDNSTQGDEGLYINGLNLAAAAGAEYIFSFDVTVANAVDLTSLIFPFQVGFYDGALPNGNIQTARLSENLAVPEPGTLLLLGTGLIGLGILGRRKFRS